MKRLIPLIAAAFLAAAASAQPLTTAFTFQGQLATSGAPATGTYDLRFRLYDALTAGNQIGPTLCTDNVAVANGLFATQLDFGAQFTGQQRYLEIDVRPDTGLSCSNSAGFTTLGPRQNLTAAPNATYAATAASATTATNASNSTLLNGFPPSFFQNAGNISSGTLANPRLSGTYSSILNLSNTSNTISGSFSGSGAGLTNIPYSAIADPPSSVLLAPSLVLAPQNGNLHISGMGQFDQAVNIGMLRPDYPFAVNGPALIKGDFSDGDMIHFGPSTSLPLGITTEAFQALLNFDMNFRVSGRNNQFKGSAVRLDARPGAPSIQFLTRPANSAVESIPMAVSELNTVYVGPTTQDLSYFEATDGGVPRTYTGIFTATGANSRALLGQTIDGSYGVVGYSSGTSGAAVWAIANSLSGNTYGLQAQNASPAGIAVYGNSSAPSGSTVAVKAEDFSTGGTALLAQEQAASGFNFAFHAISNSPNATTLFAESTPTSGNTYVIHGLNRSTSGYAGYFEGPSSDCVAINNTGSGRGLHVTTSGDTAVWAVTTSGLAGVDGRSSLSTGFGVIGQALSTTGVNYGVYGQAASASGFGLYANGRTGASGTKSFRIDHPDDPAHKYLLHYCTESPEAINFYRGTVTLNEQGEATIDLPAYFAKINKDPSYQLTALGSPMPLLHVSQEISADALAQGEKAGPTEHAPICSFTIAGGAPNAKVCWRIECLRNDRWVQVHGAPVEVNKEGPEDGTYQHPDLYNQPAQ